MDRLDAARALLGVSPIGTSTGESSSSSSSSPSPCTENHQLLPSSSPSTTMKASDETDTTNSDTSIASLSSKESSSNDKPSTVSRRPRSNSAGLEALAFLASQEQESQQQEHQSTMTVSVPNNPTLVPRPAACSSSSSSSDDDSEAMPPPPPRTAPGMPLRRPRSVSNPEGMEKWAPRENRLHFVLPASILEEELAEASEALRAKQEESSYKQSLKDHQQQQQNRPLEESSSKTIDEDEENLDQDELLRRARSRLLEDLSEGNLNGDKGVLTLPHTLEKYKNVYNKNGRIGIYTRAERAAIINRFNSKRSRRVWNKKIRYNCRKNLADRRMRVKGRFVKRSTEQEAKQATIPKHTHDIPTIQEDTHYISPDPSEKDDTTLPDQEMPDVNDPEAGFCPTEDQPYRRYRRHTIT